MSAMSDLLIDPAPGFDQPIAVLKHCHDRIRKQLRTLENLLRHLPAAGADLDAQQAATAVLRYFEQAAPKHHADEEEDLLPMLQATAVGADAALLAELAPRILAEHVAMDAAWQRIAPQLRQIAGGSQAVLSETEVSAFCASYTAHMVQEETHIAPMAKRIFSPPQMHRLGEAMRLRRGITS